jgi:hypothetical protein
MIPDPRCDQQRDPTFSHTENPNDRRNLFAVPNSCPIATASDLDFRGRVRDDRVRRTGGRAEHGVGCLFSPDDRAHGRSRFAADHLIDRSLVPAVRPGRTDADPDLDR